MARRLIFPPFGFLRASRFASATNVKSQAHEGWKLVRERYDDGGFSGGSMERPALQKLLDDVLARKIDVIVVYSPTPLPSEREALDALVANLSDLDSDQLRLQWRNHVGGIAPAHLPRWLLRTGKGGQRTVASFIRAPAPTREIQQSGESERAFAARRGLNPETVAKWRNALNSAHDKQVAFHPARSSTDHLGYGLDVVQPAIGLGHPRVVLNRLMAKRRIDAGNARDRRSAGAAGGAGGDR